MAATDATSSFARRRGLGWCHVHWSYYSVISFAVAFLLPVIAKSLGRKLHAYALPDHWRHWIDQCMFFIKIKTCLLLSMVGVGLAWSAILTMPYAMLAGALPQDKVGFYMGIFNFFIVIPQNRCSSRSWDFLMKNVFGGHSIYALVSWWRFQ